MKLHLGCGTKKIPGYINVDANPENNSDLVDDAFVLSKIPNNSIEIIYASHLLEHSGRKEWKGILKLWYEKLRNGGILRLAVPDLEKAFEHYMLYKDLPLLMGFLYGGQRNEFDYHYVGFDFKTLSKLLYDTGFSVVYRYNWWETEHAEMDDYSQSYLPHMDKENGILMSLNIEAIK